MPIALDCPHCGRAKVETANNVWFLQGFLLFARYGSKSIIGCGPCVRSQTMQSLALSSVLGWWCFPWGLGTPVVMMQNVAALLGTDDTSDLRRLLGQQGLDLDELQVDADGRSAGDRKMIAAILHTLHGMVWADGSADAREIETGAGILVAMLGEDLLTPDQARAVLAKPEAPPAESLEALSPDAQLILMKAACAIAAADDVIEPGEIEALESLGRRLGLDASITARFVAALQETVPGPDEGVREIAAALLGVPVDAPASEVRSAYQALMVQAAQEPDAEVRGQALAQLQGAYQVLLQA
ncbi:MAG: J domain-containing protein [Alphaproteobacteria bacterium]|nr:J domain-containing protein [Alphaproteobacteria bacterium]